MGDHHRLRDSVSYHTDPISSMLVANSISVNKPRSVDDLKWPFASVQGPYGMAPWNSLTMPTAASSLSFGSSSWIWAADSPYAPAGPCAFRRTYTVPAGKILESADIVMVADDSFILYVNGVSAMTGDNWEKPQFVSQNLTGGTDTPVLFAVLGINMATGSAGILAAIQINYGDGTKDMVLSDASWTVATDTPDGFQFPSFQTSTRYFTPPLHIIKLVLNGN